MKVDALNILAWQNTKDGAKGRNKPKSMLDYIRETDKKKKNGGSEVMAFNSSAEFEEYRRKLLENGY